jgi:hypothetical protein
MSGINSMPDLRDYRPGIRCYLERCKADSRQQSSMIETLNLIPAWTFPSGDFFMFDYVGYYALIGGLLARKLRSWHPLLSGNPDSVQDAGVSISSYAMKESDIDDLEDHIIEWLE